MLALEQFAKIRAEIERTGDRDAALIGAGIDAREWIRVQRHWLRELAEEVEGGRTSLAVRYCSAYLGASGARPAEELAEMAPLSGGSVVTPSYLAQPVAIASVHPAAPIPVLAASTPVQFPATPVSFAGTAMVFELPRGPAMPFREGASDAASAVLSPSGPGERPREVSPARSGETAMVLELPQRLVTPFSAQSRPESAPEPRAPGSPPGASPAPVQETVLDIGLAPAGPSTPFAAPETGPFGLTLRRYVEIAAACQEPGASPEKVMSRFGLAGVSFADVDSAWKTKLRASASLALEYHRRLTDEIQSLAERRREAAERPKKAGKTVATPVQHIAPAVTPVQGTPPVAALEPGTPRGAPPGPPAELTVEQYAWVVATLRKATSPAELEQALARFRLTAESRKQLEELWRARMAVDPALQSRFLSLLTRYLQGSTP